LALCEDKNPFHCRYLGKIKGKLLDFTSWLEPIQPMHRPGMRWYAPSIDPGQSTSQEILKNFLRINLGKKDLKIIQFCL